MIYTGLPGGAGRVWAGCWLRKPLVSALLEGNVDPVSVHAGDTDITRSSLRLAGTKVTC